MAICCNQSHTNLMHIRMSYSVWLFITASLLICICTWKHKWYFMKDVEIIIHNRAAGAHPLDLKIIAWRFWVHENSNMYTVHQWQTINTKLLQYIHSLYILLASQYWYPQLPRAVPAVIIVFVISPENTQLSPTSQLPHVTELKLLGTEYHPIPQC